MSKRDLWVHRFVEPPQRDMHLGIENHQSEFCVVIGNTSRSTGAANSGKRTGETYLQDQIRVRGGGHKLVVSPTSHCSIELVIGTIRPTKIRGQTGSGCIRNKHFLGSCNRGGDGRGWHRVFWFLCREERER